MQFLTGWSAVPPKVLFPPDPLPPRKRGEIRIFLAGSIEQGSAEPWQDRVIEAFQDYEKITFLNPRRKVWDPTLTQDPANPVFRGQVKWELDGLDLAQVVVMWFDPATKSPISLLELGLMARVNRVRTATVVGCPEGFWRRGNVQIVCERWEIPILSSFDEFIQTIIAVSASEGV